MQNIDMAQLTRELYNDLLARDTMLKEVLASNREHLQEIDLENEKEREKSIKTIKDTGEIIIQHVLDFKEIILKTPNAEKVIKHIIHKPLRELDDEEIYILKSVVKNIDVKFMLTSKIDAVSILGRVINYLQGEDPHKQLILKKIADADSLINLYHTAKQAETNQTPEPEQRRERAGSLESRHTESPRAGANRSLLSSSLSSLSVSLRSSLHLPSSGSSSPRTPRVDEIFAKSSPSLHRGLDEKIGSPQSPKSKGRK